MSYGGYQVVLKITNLILHLVVVGGGNVIANIRNLIEI